VARERVPDLDSLALLLEIAAAGSLGRAAVGRGMSQPAVSARMQAVERLVGFPVLHRSARGSELTQRGALLADWARSVLAAADVLDVGIASLREEREAQLRVAASLTVAEHLLPRWLAQFAAGHPQAHVSLTAGNSAAVGRAVLDDLADLGFVEGPAVPSGLKHRVVAVDELMVVVAPTHPWARRRRPLTGDELAATRLVQREPASGTRTFLEAALGHCVMAPPVLELSTSGAVSAAAAAGAAPAVLSALAVGADLAAGRLRAVPVEGVDLRRELRAVWSTARLSNAAKDLLAIADRDRPHS
jgi:DNA-binding transcriptional LysR family regulator